MTAHSLRQKLQNGEATVGSWLQLPSPDTAEIMAHMGYDWLVVDMEHGSIDIGHLPNLFRAIASGSAQGQGALAMVRVPKGEELVIRRALDAGAQGLIFPMVQSRAQLDQAIQAALYPHEYENTGRRGVGYARANGYGQHFTQYMQSADEVMLIAQIEHVDALHELEAMVQHPRLDAIMVGPYDLSASMGLMGKFSHPLFVQAMQEIQTICAQYAMPMGTHVVQPSPEALRQAKEQGYVFLAYGLDAHFLWQAAVRPEIA